MRELWRFRELVLTLGLRDLKLRYRQTFLGVTWVVLQPLIGAGIFSFIFGRLGNLSSDHVPYFLFAFAGMMGWNAFQTTLTKASTCLVGNAHLVSKVYFPRIALPLSTIFAALIDFLVSVPMLIVILIYYRGSYHFHFTPELLLVPVWLTMLLALAVGFGLFCSALAVQYRDVQFIVPVMVNFLMWGSPVAYSMSNVATRVPARLQTLYKLNPLSGLMAAFRSAMLGTGETSMVFLPYAVGVTFVVLIAGAYAFRRMEQRFADVI